MCTGALLHDAGSLRMTFDGSCTEKQWLSKEGSKLKL